jgi:copper(I)-binding protein
VKILATGCLAWMMAAPAAACDGLAALAGWVREPVPGSAGTAAYVTLLNRGATPVRVTGVLSTDFAHAMLHETRYVDGNAHMHGRDELELAPGERYEGAPGGAHIMLGHPRHPLAAGAIVRLRFTCAGGAPLEVSLPVMKRAPE